MDMSQNGVMNSTNTNSNNADNMITPTMSGNSPHNSTSMTSMSTMTVSSTNSYILIGLGIIGTLVGLLALISIIVGLKGLGGEIAKAFVLILIGLAFMVIAFTWTFLDQFFTFLPMDSSMIVHISLMLIGMITFVFAANKFMNLSK